MGVGKDLTTIFNLMPPLGMLSIIAFLESRGIDAEIIDCYATPMTADELITEIIRRAPDVVGFSCTTSSFLEGYGFAALLKEQAPQIVTVFGGAHACSVGVSLLDDFPAIDYLVIGEGEVSFCELVAAGCRNVETIPGIGYRRDGRGTLSAVRETDTRPGHPSLSGLPSAPRVSPALQPAALQLPEGAEHQHHLQPRLPLPVLLLRPFGLLPGLPLQLAGIHRRTPEDAATGTSASATSSFTMTSSPTDRSRVARFCELKEQKRLPVTYNCIARLEHVDAELLALLKRSGCWQVNFGIESGDPEVLGKHRKFYGLDEVRTKAAAWSGTRECG